MKIQNVSNDVIPIYVNKGISLKNKLQPGDVIEVSESDAKWNAVNHYEKIEILGKKKKEKADDEGTGPVGLTKEKESKKKGGKKRNK